MDNRTDFEIKKGARSRRERAVGTELGTVGGIGPRPPSRAGSVVSSLRRYILHSAAGLTLAEDLADRRARRRSAVK